MHTHTHHTHTHGHTNTHARARTHTHTHTQHANLEGESNVLRVDAGVGLDDRLRQRVARHVPVLCVYVCVGEEEGRGGKRDGRGGV